MNTNKPSIRITENRPCGICTPDNIQKHCFSCGKCGIKFISEITHSNGIDYGLCSPKCEKKYIITREYSKHGWRGLKGMEDYF